jgi:hypothetical protein
MLKLKMCDFEKIIILSILTILKVRIKKTLFLQIALKKLFFY